MGIKHIASEACFDTESDVVVAVYQHNAVCLILGDSTSMIYLSSH